jgi:5-methylcytosine-specific restriction endonuclease McrA
VARSGYLEGIIHVNALSVKLHIGMKYVIINDENYLEQRKANDIRQSLEEDKVYLCKDCGRSVYLNGRNKDNSLILHHKKPLLCGGTSNKRNLIILCNDCHKNRHFELNLKPELPLFRKRKVIGYRKGGVFTEAD